MVATVAAMAGPGTVDEWRDEIRRRLVVAMRARRRPDVSALRSVLAAIDNAEAVPAEGGGSTVVPGPIAGTVVGFAAQAPRRRLRTDEVRALVHAELDERRQAAAAYRDRGLDEEAQAVEAEARVIEQLLTGEG